MIVVVHYDVGNISSILTILRIIGCTAIVSHTKEDIKRADKIILPGVGSFDVAMEALHRYNLVDTLYEAVMVEKKFLLGICLGAQILGRSSQEGHLPGLGFLPMYNKKFCDTKRIPHMGWNTVKPSLPSLLFPLEKTEEKFYFAHSYYMACDSKETCIATTDYGDHFCAAVAQDNIFGVQFHPEKSHRYGMKLLKNFINAS